MELLYFLESIRTPFWNTVLGALTYLGDEIAFIAVTIIVYWCAEKRKGFYIMLTGMLSMVTCHILKIVMRVPRPYVKDPDFTIVGDAKARANDYSFPSGHSQNASSSFGAVARMTEKKWLRWVCVGIIAVVAFSRLYLGVHTPWDVLAGLAIGVIGVLLLWPLFRDMEKHKKAIGALYIVQALLGIGLMVYMRRNVTLGIGDAELNAGSLKNAYVVGGGSIGFAIAYFADTCFVHADTKAPLPGQILKIVLGLGLMILIKSVLKEPLYALTGGQPYADCIRYCVMTLFGTVVWPLTFPLWQKVGKKK